MNVTMPLQILSTPSECSVFYRNLHISDHMSRFESVVNELRNTLIVSHPLQESLPLEEGRAQRRSILERLGSICNNHFSEESWVAIQITHLYKLIETTVFLLDASSGKHEAILTELELNIYRWFAIECVKMAWDLTLSSHVKEPLWEPQRRAKVVEFFVNLITSIEKRKSIEEIKSAIFSTSPFLDQLGLEFSETFFPPLESLTVDGLIEGDIVWVRIPDLTGAKSLRDAFFNIKTHLNWCSYEYLVIDIRDNNTHNWIPIPPHPPYQYYLMRLLFGGDKVWEQVLQNEEHLYTVRRCEAYQNMLLKQLEIRNKNRQNSLYDKQLEFLGELMKKLKVSEGESVSMCWKSLIYLDSRFPFMGKILVIVNKGTGGLMIQFIELLLKMFKDRVKLLGEKTGDGLKGVQGPYRISLGGKIQFECPLLEVTPGRFEPYTPHIPCSKEILINDILLKEYIKEHLDSFFFQKCCVVS